MMNGITGDGLTSNDASGIQQEPGSQPGHGHVNSIRSILGLDREETVLGRFTAHTKRKLAELQASRKEAAATGGEAGWAASMKPESLGQSFLKANSKPFMISVGIFCLMAFWLFVIRSVHHTEEPNHVVSNEKWGQQIASSNQTVPPQSVTWPVAPTVNQPTPGVPASFGSPNPIGYEQTAMPAQASLPTAFPQSAAAPQMFSPYPSMYAPVTPGNQMRVPASNFSMQQQPNLIPVRQHIAARYKVVVTR